MAKKAHQGEMLDADVVDRFEAATRSALRRKPAHEERLAGAVRSLTPWSPRLTQQVLSAVDILINRASFGRPLYAAAVRALAHADGKDLAPLLNRALATEEAGGLCTLSACTFLHDKAIGSALARVAASRHPHLAFAAEVARIARGESGGQHIVAVAPKIKESHRIALCVELFVPLLAHPALPAAIAPAIAVLRDAERHLGRWLVFGEIAARAGDPRPLAQASERAASGPGSARSAWAFVAWALRANAPEPSVRPTVELVSRLSDRPSADRDPSFLFRLADARARSARAMLDNLAKPPLRTPAAIRAALYLARDYGRDDLGVALQNAAVATKEEALRGMAVAALHDVGLRPSEALRQQLLSSRQLQNVAWAGLLSVGISGHLEPVVSEQTYRRVQLGWVE